MKMINFPRDSERILFSTKISFENHRYKISKSLKKDVITMYSLV